MAATVTAVPILRYRAILAAVVVTLTFEIIGVASGTIRLIHRERPINDLLVNLVTLGTSEIATMVEGFIDQADVPVDMRQPGICRVADIALLVRHEMAVVLARCRIAVMAGRAGTQHLRVIDV